MKTTICPLCVCVSSLWLLMSAGIAWGYFSPSTWLIPAALLMGGTVVGIAYLGEKRCRWASLHPLAWKTLVVFIGMPIAYFLLVHLTKITVIAEFFLLFTIAYFFFIKQSRIPATGTNSQDSDAIREIEEQMKQCC